MAKDSISIASLFGITPEEYKYQQAQRDLDVITQSNNSGLGQLFMLAGRQSGNAVAGLMGVQDPTLNRLTKIQSVGKMVKDMGIDPNNPDEVYPAMIKGFQDMGLTQEAVLAAQQYQGFDMKRKEQVIEGQKAQAALTKAWSDKKTAAGKAIDPKIAQSAKIMFGKDVDSLDDLTQDELLMIDKRIDSLATELRTPEDFARTGKTEFKINPKPYLWQYSNEEAKQIQDYIDSQKAADAERRKPVTKIDNRIQVQGEKNVLEIDKKDAEDYLNMRTASQRALKTLGKMADNYREGVNTGTGANVRTDLLRVLDTFGVSTGKAKDVLANTEEFNKQVNELVQGIIKNFGYNPSNTDLTFAIQSLPNISNSPEGLRRLINGLIKEHQDILEESNRALSHFRRNKGSFEGFEPKRQLATPVSNAANIPRSELEAEARARGLIK